VNSKAATRKSQSPKSCSSGVTVLKLAKSLLTQSVTNKHDQLAGVSLCMPSAKASVTPCHRNFARQRLCCKLLWTRKIQGLTLKNTTHFQSRTRVQPDLQSGSLPHSHENTGGIWQDLDKMYLSALLECASNLDHAKLFSEL